MIPRVIVVGSVKGKLFFKIKPAHICVLCYLSDEGGHCYSRSSSWRREKAPPMAPVSSSTLDEDDPSSPSFSVSISSESDSTSAVGLIRDIGSAIS